MPRVYNKLMNLIKNHHNHRGVIGVEAAIILIAFVLIAAALAFLVLNTGFSTAQKAKTTIGSTLASSTNNLEVEGTVIASSYLPAGVDGSLNVTSVPIKIAGGGDSVNLDPAITAVKYLSDELTYDDIYAGTLQAIGSFNSLESATNAAVGEGYISQSPFLGGDGDSDDWPLETAAFIYWTVSVDTNSILDSGEHANLVIVFAAGDKPEYLDTMRIEVIQANGASLSLERKVPSISSEVVDLG